MRFDFFVLSLPFTLCTFVFIFYLFTVQPCKKELHVDHYMEYVVDGLVPARPWLEATLEQWEPQPMGEDNTEKPRTESA